MRKNKVLGVGCNMNRTHTRSNNKWRTLHAELAAVLNAGLKDISGATIFIYRENASGNLAMAKPCPFCDELLRRVGIKRVRFTVNDGFSECTF